MTDNKPASPVLSSAFEGDAFVGLSSDDRARIEAALGASHAESTRTV